MPKAKISNQCNRHDGTECLSSIGNGGNFINNVDGCERNLLKCGEGNFDQGNGKHGISSQGMPVSEKLDVKQIYNDDNI
jgi:hypothetical protein